MNKRTISWTAPPRPDWVQRINDEGRWMNISGIVPLTAGSLIDAAIQTTGLSDFGEGDWYEPFQVVCKSLEEDSQLNLMGRIRTRSEMLQLLEARLQIEDTYKRHPEIDAQEIVTPLIIVGQGRSGTSFLLNLLAAHPDNGVVKMWEAVLPCPPPEKETYLTDSRIERAHQLTDQWNRVTPTIASMHEFSGYVPQDCTHILALSFRSEAWFNFLGQVPSYNKYIATLGQTPAFHYHKRVLKLLQWKNPRSQWVLKDPTHLEKMMTILKVYPDCEFVWPHRDPVKALASTISIIGTAQWGRSDHPFLGGALEQMVDPVLSAKRLGNLIDLLESGVIPKSKVCHLLYSDLVAAPMATIERIYKYFDLPLTPAGRAGMNRYLAENPRAARPPHKFDIGSAESVGRAREAYKRYQDYFGVPNE
jgi:hypothetical protein